MEKFKSFEELECWKAATIVRRTIKEILKKFPTHEKFSLTDNMSRASRSVTENIAEGFGRFHYQENIQFCQISRGSLFELIDQYITALDEKYISEEEYKMGREQITTTLRILNGNINYLEKQKKVKRINS
jgi:four helix bundle protein